MEEMVIVDEGKEWGITLSGELDFGKAEEFFEGVIQTYNAAPKNIRFDCAALEFIDSTILGTFVKILKTVQANGNTLRLTGLQPKIKKLFVICALDGIMEIA